MCSFMEREIYFGLCHEAYNLVSSRLALFTSITTCLRNEPYVKKRTDKYNSGPCNSSLVEETGVNLK